MHHFQNESECPIDTSPPSPPSIPLPLCHIPFPFPRLAKSAFQIIYMKQSESVNQWSEIPLSSPPPHPPHQGNIKNPLAESWGGGGAEMPHRVRAPALKRK